MLLTRQNYMSVEAAAAQYIKMQSKCTTPESAIALACLDSEEVRVFPGAIKTWRIHEFFTKRNAYILSLLHNGEAHSTHFFSTMEYRNIFSFTACDYSHHVYFFSLFLYFCHGLCL